MDRAVDITRGLEVGMLPVMAVDQMVDMEVVAAEEKDTEVEANQDMVPGGVLGMDPAMKRVVEALKAVGVEAAKDTMGVVVLGLVLGTVTMDNHENDRFSNKIMCIFFQEHACMYSHVCSMRY